MKFVIAEKSFAIFTAVMNDKKIIIKMRHNVSDINVHTTNLEEELLVKARHPNIIRAYAAGFRPKRFLVVDDYLLGGTLDSIIRQHSRGLPIKMALSIAMELALALKYLHQDMHPNAMVILRGNFYMPFKYKRLILILYYNNTLDISPSIIGFSEGDKLKLFDFGCISCIPKNTSSSNSYSRSTIRSRKYMAPELALSCPYDEKVDIFSFGIIFWQMLSGETPFPTLSHDEYVQKVAHGGLRPSLDPVRNNHNHHQHHSSSSSSSTSSTPQASLYSVIELLERCWHANPKERPAAESIVRELSNIITNSSSPHRACNLFPLLRKNFENLFK